MLFRAAGRYVLGCTLLFCALTGIDAPAHAQANSVTLAWDANPEDFVAGYFVYVARSGASTYRFDAGRSTQFTYAQVIADVGYSFSVAAYTTRGIVGPRSSTVFYLGGSSTASASAPLSLSVSGDQDKRPAVVPGSASLRAGAPAPGATGSSVSFPVCAEARPEDCYTARAIASFQGRVTSLAVLPDERVVLIEDGQRVYIDGGPALTVQAPAEIVSLAVDPAFATTRIVYVGRAEPRRDGRRTIDIVRYREVGGVLGQAAVIVAGLPLADEGGAPLAVDADGRIYVAMPEVENRGTDAAYSARVLRFEPDGTSRGIQAFSPVFSLGLARPLWLTWSVDATLWLAGAGLGDTGEVRIIATGSDPAVQSLPVSFATDLALRSLSPGAGAAVGRGLAVDASGSLFQVSVVDRRAEMDALSLPAGQRARLVALSQTGTRYLVVQDAGMSTSDTLLRLDLR